MHRDNKSVLLKAPLDLIVVLLLVFIVYVPCLQNEFVNWDTDEYLLKNTDIRSLGYENIRRMFTSSVLDGYSPLTSLSFAVEYHFFGYNAFVYHLNNILLHLAVVGLIFLFSLQCGLSRKAAVFSALLFGVHPMHVESVAWVVERKDVLYALFYMAALCSYMRYVQKGRKSAYIGVLLFGLLSILAKSMALSLPLIMLLCDWFKKRQMSFKLIVEKVPVLLYVFSIAWITFSLHARSPDAGTIVQAALTWIWTFVFYLQKFLFPVILLPLYSLPLPVSFTNIHYLLSSLFFFTIVGLLIKFRKRRWLVFAVLYYFLSIFFLLRFDGGDISIVADRFMYLPSLGFCMLFGLIVEKFLHTTYIPKTVGKTAAVIVLTVLFGLLSVKTVMQCRIWKSSFILWDYVAKKNPGASAAYLNMGNSHINEGDYSKALFFLEKAVAMDKKNVIGISNLGTAHFHLGHFDTAEKYLKYAIMIRPDYVPSLNSLGLLYLEKGDYSNAARYFSDAIKAGPAFFEPRNNLALIYEKQNNSEEAEKLYKENLTMDPNHYQSLYSLLALYMKEKKEENIVELCGTILQKNRDVEALLRLASALAENDYSQMAIDLLTRAAQLDPQCKDAFVLLGNIHGNNQQFDKAILFWREALKIDPGDRSLRNQIEKVKMLEINSNR